MLEEKIIELKKELIEYASLIEEMISKSIKGLLEKNKDILDEVINIDEFNANSKEIEIDEMCTNMIAQFDPMAKNLRTILMIYKMNNDMERLGDHAVNIAQSSLFLIERPFVKKLMDVPRMTHEVISMLKDSINSFINEDACLAKKVCERDSVVDDLKNQIIRELITYMISDPKTIERSLHLMRITGNLERISDLSTNIGEEVIFMVQGRIIKHHQNIDDNEKC